MWMCTWSLCYCSFTGMWKGLTPRIIMIGTLTALQWFIYDSVKVYFRMPRPPPPEMPESLKRKLGQGQQWITKTWELVPCCKILTRILLLLKSFLCVARHSQLDVFYRTIGISSGKLFFNKLINCDVLYWSSFCILNDLQSNYVQFVD